MKTSKRLFTTRDIGSHSNVIAQRPAGKPTDLATPFCRPGLL
jgi:hypothetical protein